MLRGHELLGAGYVQRAGYVRRATGHNYWGQ